MVHNIYKNTLKTGNLHLNELKIVVLKNCNVELKLSIEYEYYIITKYGQFLKSSV